MGMGSIPGSLAHGWPMPAIESPLRTSNTGLLLANHIFPRSASKWLESKGLRSETHGAQGQGLGGPASAASCALCSNSPPTASLLSSLASAPRRDLLFPSLLEYAQRPAHLISRPASHHFNAHSQSALIALHLLSNLNGCCISCNCFALAASNHSLVSPHCPSTPHNQTPRSIP